MTAIETRCRIPLNIADVVVTLLAPYCRDLTTDLLQEALSFQLHQPPDDLMTVPEAASTLHVSTRTIIRLLDCGDLPRIKIRNSVRIPRSAVDALIAGKTIN